MDNGTARFLYSLAGLRSNSGLSAAPALDMVEARMVNAHRTGVRHVSVLLLCFTLGYLAGDASSTCVVGV